MLLLRYKMQVQLLLVNFLDNQLIESTRAYDQTTISDFWHCGFNCLCVIFTKYIQKYFKCRIA